MSMEESPAESRSALPLILRGCKLAKDLEARLPHLVQSQPDLLLFSCQEIVSVFNQAAAKMRQKNPSDDSDHLLVPSASTSTSPQQLVTMDILRPLETMERQQPEGADSGDRSRKSRKDSKEKRTQRVPAPRTGNLEAAPEDGFTWRKYGQKEILGSRFPRSYYRCSNSKLYGCMAKKQVQRVDDDPFTFEVSYRGNHSCTPSLGNSSASDASSSLLLLGCTAQSGLGLQPPPPLPSPSLPLVAGTPATWRGWTNFEVPFKDNSSSAVDPFFLHLSTGGGDQETFKESGFQDTSGKEREMGCSALDLAAVMFNSQSSGGNNIDAIFSSKEDEQ